MHKPLLWTQAEIDSWATSGAAYDRALAIATTDPGSGDLETIHNLHPNKVQAMAMMWAKNGLGGIGSTVEARRQYIQAEIVQGLSTYVNANSSPLYQFMQFCAYINAANLINMPFDTPIVPGVNFGQFCDLIPTHDFPGNERWSNLVKCTTDSGSNWGTAARAGLLSVALLRNQTSNINLCIQTFKRWCNEPGVPNTFGDQSSINDAWVTPSGNRYPEDTGVINPATSDLTRAGANVVDGSRPSGSPPPMTDDAAGYSMDAYGGSLAVAVMLLHNGEPQALTWGNQALRRWTEHFDRSTTVAPSGYWAYSDAHQGSRRFFAVITNHLFGTNYPFTASTGSQAGRKEFPDTAAWYAGGSSTWGTTSSSPEEPEEPTPVPPQITLSLSKAAQDYTLSASASVTQGTGTISRVTFDWLDGTSPSVDTTFPYSQLHTYATSGNKSVKATVLASDGLTASVTAGPLNLPEPGDTSPTIVFAALDATRGRDPHTVTFSLAGSAGYQGNPITAVVNFGDGSVLDPASVTGSIGHPYTATEYPTSYTARATITDTVTGLTASATIGVTVDAPLTQARYLKLLGRKVEGELVAMYGTPVPGSTMETVDARGNLDVARPAALIVAFLVNVGDPDPTHSIPGRDLIVEPPA